MSIKVTYKNADLGKEKEEVINHFIDFLYDKMPVNNIKDIIFLGNKKGDMTTGSYTVELGLIKVLSKGRMLIDILRTISHEWVHEYQYQEMGLDDKKKIQDIGGPEENMSNVLSGIFIKKFEL